MLVSTDPKMEFVNYHANTSLFALSIIQQNKPLNQQKLFSIACLMPHLADYLALFHTVHHSSLVETHWPAPPDRFPAKLFEHRNDFFELPPLDIDCVISHAAIHCFNDTRYGNTNNSTGWQRPYQVPAKLRQIIGKKQIPIILSISVNKDEAFIDNNTHLSHDKFIQSFRASGFELQDHFFDYVCGGIPQKPDYLKLEYRRSKTLPPIGGPQKDWIVGNYHFQ